MQKEEKQLELSLEALIGRVQDLKNSLAAFLHKLENEYNTLSWPSVLDNFALLSSQLNSLTKVLKNDRVPALRNHVLLPLVLSPDRDAELEKLTEGRVLMFNHEVVPDYLRTKPEPEVEEKMQQLVSKSTGITPDIAQTKPEPEVKEKLQLLVSKSTGRNPDIAQKQLNNLNKITSNILDIINSAKEEWDSEANQKVPQQSTATTADTNNLVAATLFGKGLKSRRGEPQSTPGMSTPPTQQQQKLPGASMTKAPSSIKTQIKAGSTPHPYQRP